MDRLLANTYLDFFLSEALFDEADLVPFGAGAATFKAPPAGASFERCLGYIDGHFGDNPMAFGLHPNTELDYRVTVSNAVFLQLSELQPKDGGAVDAGASPQQVAEAVMSDVRMRRRARCAAMRRAALPLLTRAPRADLGQAGRHPLCDRGDGGAD